MTVRNFCRAKQELGIDASVMQLSRDHGLKPETVYCRIYNGWSLAEALGVEERKKPETVKAMALKRGIPVTRVRSRVCHLGWTLAQALGDEPPPMTVHRRARVARGLDPNVTIRSIMAQRPERPKSLSQQAREAGVNYATVKGRLRRGWTTDQALGRKPLSKRQVRENKKAQLLALRAGRISRRGVEQVVIAEVLRSFAAKLDVNYHTVRNRLRRGWTLRQALELDPPDVLPVLIADRHLKTLAPDLWEEKRERERPAARAYQRRPRSIAKARKYYKKIKNDPERWAALLKRNREEKRTQRESARQSAREAVAKTIKEHGLDKSWRKITG